MKQGLSAPRAKRRSGPSTLLQRHVPWGRQHRHLLLLSRRVRTGSAGDTGVQSATSTFELDLSSISVNASSFYYPVQQASPQSTFHPSPKQQTKGTMSPSRSRDTSALLYPMPKCPGHRGGEYTLQEKLYPHIWYPGGSELALGSLGCESLVWCSGMKLPFRFVASENLYQKSPLPRFLCSPAVGMKPGRMELQPSHLLIQLHSSCYISSCILPLARRGSQHMPGTCHRCSLELIYI